ncbi:serine hydrolase domain-containing protein [Streptomyces sp. NPDC017979]|uniref:serine hydrolase domain-containing protein n=1 Tax=Streptomyces sp. NPDC017979 TaxID=3365024 RepID=UPI0037B2C6E5
MTARRLKRTGAVGLVAGTLTLTALTAPTAQADPTAPTAILTPANTAGLTGGNEAGGTAASGNEARDPRTDTSETGDEGTGGSEAPGAGGAGASGSTSPGSRGNHQATQRALEALVAGGLPGATATATDGHGVWQGTAGVGNLRTGTPRGADDRFRIASITKTFVATVLLQLEAEGALDLDDTVEKWLPGLVRGNGHDGRTITVRQLLNHTSGVYDYLADTEYLNTYALAPGFLVHRFDNRTPQAAVRVAMRHAPAFSPPGSEYSYSNTNYVLAGLIIEKASGNTYEHEVRKRIINPLGLRATTMPGNSSHMPRPSSRAYSQLSTDPAATKIYDVTLQNASQSWADGDMISSAADLNRFFSALLRGQLLPPQQLKAMKTTTPDGHGLGLERLPTRCGTTVWGHAGGWIGSLSVAVTTEDGGHSLAYNTNGDWREDGLYPVIEAEYCGTAKPTS